MLIYIYIYVKYNMYIYICVGVCTYMTVEMKDLTCAIIFETRGTYWLRRDPTYPEWDLEENMFTIIVQLKSTAGLQAQANGILCAFFQMWPPLDFRRPSLVLVVTDQLQVQRRFQPGQAFPGRVASFNTLR